MGAASACTIDQTHLADITSAEEQAFVAKLLREAGGEDAWFGLTLLDTFSWSDGSIFSNDSWYDLTSTSHTICFRLQKQTTESYILSDGWACEHTSRYICEYKGSHWKNKLSNLIKLTKKEKEKEKKKQNKTKKKPLIWDTFAQLIGKNITIVKDMTF